ncbi:hypothetical protein PILCRDRAFT_814163, partial [Piloderma croceum F 1598]
MRKLAEENNIELFCLPPHTTHRTQPLDVGVFGPCDAGGWNNVIMSWMRRAFLPGTIQKAWRKCGICPLKPDIFTDTDFAPSTSTSTLGHFPASYPISDDDTDLEAEEE